MDGLIVTGTYCLISGATVLLWLLAQGQTWTIVFASVYGFLSGGLVSLPPATVVALSKTPDEYSTRVGWAFTIGSFGALVGNPIAGALLDVAKRSGPPFLGPWLFAGGTMILAAVFTVVAYSLHNRHAEASDKLDPQDPESQPGDRPRTKWLQSLIHEALTMQSSGAFAS